MLPNVGWWLPERMLTKGSIEPPVIRARLEAGILPNRGERDGAILRRLVLEVAQYVVRRGSYIARYVPAVARYPLGHTRPPSVPGKLFIRQHSRTLDGFGCQPPPDL
jgi:hypothetical protein